MMNMYINLSQFSSESQDLTMHVPVSYEMHLTIIIVIFEQSAGKYGFVLNLFLFPFYFN